MPSVNPSHLMRDGLSLPLILFGLLASGCLLLLALASCSGSGASGADIRKSPPASPQAFYDDSFAELATDGEHGLWMVIAGYNRHGGGFGAKVFREGSSEWEMLRALPGQISTDGPINIVFDPKSGEGSPCIGYSAKRSEEARVVCWDGGTWQAQSLDNALPQGARLLQLANDGDRLVALLESRPTPRSSTFTVLERGTHGWSQAGEAIDAPGALAQLGVNPAANSALTVGIETQTQTPVRYVLGLEGRQWTRQGKSLEGPGIGPFVSGPISVGTSTFFPVINSEVQPWTFSSFAQRGRSSWHRPGGETLNQGSGNAQGSLDYGAGSIWATWQQNEETGHRGLFETKVYAAKLGSSGEATQTIKLWSGLSIGPGNTQVIEYEGNPLALYMRSEPNSHGSLRPAMEFLPAN